jgi:hypothetical protein
MLSLRDHLGSLLDFGGVRVAHLSVFCVMFCLSSSSVLCSRPFLIAPSVFSNVYYIQLIILRLLSTHHHQSTGREIIVVM